tara:strand:+ start:1181 stop:1318 length:138 start_codon:yes stop_codon:yes gene_type:complete
MTETERRNKDRRVNPDKREKEVPVEQNRRNGGDRRLTVERRNREN